MNGSRSRWNVFIIFFFYYDGLNTTRGRITKKRWLKSRGGCGGWGSKHRLLSLSLSATHFLLVISLSPRIYPGFTSISTSIYSQTSFSSSVWIVRIFAFKNNPPRGKTFSSNTCQRSLYGEDRDIRKNKPFFFFLKWQQCVKELLHCSTVLPLQFHGQSLRKPSISWAPVTHTNLTSCNSGEVTPRGINGSAPLLCLLCSTLGVNRGAIRRS